MKTFSSTRFIAALVLCFMALITSATACPACYGAANNNTMDAANTAVMTLLGITGFVLSGIIGFGLYMWKRMKKTKETISKNSFVDDNGIIHIDNKGTYEWNIS